MNDDDDTWRKRRPVDDEHTPVFDILDRALDADETEDVRHCQRDGDSHATVGDLVKIIRRSRQDQARIAELERDASSAKRVIRWIGGAAIGSVLSVVGLIYSRGLSDGAYQIRIEHIERSLDEVRARVYDRRSEVAVPQPVFASTKDLP